MAFGTPLDPNTAPPKPAKGGVNPRYGEAVQMGPPASKAAVLRSVALGYTSGAEAPQLPPGVSSRGSNFIGVGGGLVPRPGLRSLGTPGSSFTYDPPTWIGQLDTVVVALGMNPMRAASAITQWSLLSYFSSTYTTGTLFGAMDNGYYSATPYYHPTTDRNELLISNVQGFTGSDTWTYSPSSSSDALAYSTMTRTGATLRGGYVVYFDDRLVFARDAEVEWSTRGAPETYTTPDGGVELLSNARGGGITGLFVDGDRLLVLFRDQVWVGYKAPFPFNFQFTLLSGEVGCMAPRSAAQTPHGIVFLGSDYNLWVIPSGGAPKLFSDDVSALLNEQLTGDWFGRAFANDAAGGWHDELNAYILSWMDGNFKAQGLAVRLTGRGVEWNPLSFDVQSANSWHIRCFGQLSTSTKFNIGNYGRGRLVGASSLRSGSTMSTGDLFEFTSLATDDLGSRISCTRFVIVPNDNPSERQIVRELRLDYRCDSASSLSVRMTPDFGTTYPVSVNVALPPAPLSAQTAIHVSISAAYPGIELRHDSGHTFALQGLTAIVESGGNG